MSYQLQTLNPRELAEMANSFSNFDEQEFFSALDSSDEALNFGDDEISSFSQEGAVQRQFTFNVDNNNTSATLKFFIVAGVASDRLVTIKNPTLGALASGAYPVTGFIDTKVWAPIQGLMQDDYFLDIAGTGTSSVNGLVATSTSNKTILELQQFLRVTPARLLKVKVVSDSSTQIQAPIILKTVNPFKVEAERELYPANAQNQFVNQDKISVIETNVTLGPNDIVQYSVAPNSQVSVTLYFGANLDNSRKLQKMATRGNTRVPSRRALNRR